MILRSGLTPSEFITQTLLIPFCDFIVEGLFESHVSIEAHAQNLGWIINQETLQPIKLAYRDMGGVNILNIESKLSGALSNSDYYFSDKHCKDAAATIETHFVSSLLFALTKRFVNTNYSSGIDSDFRQWADLWASAPYRINWTTDSDVPDRHATDIPQDQFVRYGYIELMFGRLLTMKLKESGIFDRLAKQYSYLKNTDTTYYDNFCNNHTVSELFRPMILTLYSHYLELSP